MSSVIKYGIFFYLALFSLSAGGQKLVLKKETRIKYYYYNGEPGHSDTSIFKYDDKGKLLYASSSERFSVREVVLDSSKNRFARQEIFSDSSRETSIYMKFQDSTVNLHIRDDRDTFIWIKKNIKRNFFRIKYKVTYAETFSSPSVKVELRKSYYNKLLRTRKEYQYDTIAGKWLVRYKEKLNRKYKPVRITVYIYNYFLQKYITVYTRFRYNSYGQIILEEDKNQYGDVEKKTIYLYEYY